MTHDRPTSQTKRTIPEHRQRKRRRTRERAEASFNLRIQNEIIAMEDWKLNFKDQNISPLIDQKARIREQQIVRQDQQIARQDAVIRLYEQQLGLRDQKIKIQAEKMECYEAKFKARMEASRLKRKLSDLQIESDEDGEDYGA